MAYKHCEECGGGMRRHTLWEALIDKQQVNGKWEVRNDQC